MPVATITIPKSSVTSSSSSSLSINQLLTPSNPFSTPLTSYLLGSEEKDDKESPRRSDEAQLIVRPPSPTNGQTYFKSPRQQSGYYLPPHANMPVEFHNNCRTSVEFLTSAPPHPYTQQTQLQPQHVTSQESLPYVLPKLNFSPTSSQQPSPYINSPTTKFRPPSPITSSHQQPVSFNAPVTDGFARHAPAHFFHHYHPQMHASTSFKTPYSQQQIQQQPQSLPSQPPPQQSQPPMVLRWVMEYEKPVKK
jgi:hypothetical protein